MLISPVATFDNTKPRPYFAPRQPCHVQNATSAHRTPRIPLTCKNDTLHSCAAKLARGSCTLAAQLRRKKTKQKKNHTALIYVDTLKCDGCCSWCFFFPEKYMALSDSWQEKSCLRCVKRCKRVLVRCWHCLRSEYVCWRMLVFLFFVFFYKRIFSFVLFSKCVLQYFIPVNTILKQEVAETNGSPGTGSSFGVFCHNVHTRIKNVLCLSCIVRVWPWASSPFSFPSFLYSSPGSSSSSYFHLLGFFYFLFSFLCCCAYNFSK